MQEVGEGGAHAQDQNGQAGYGGGDGLGVCGLRGLG
jgi:hypothetical protein